MPDLHWEGYNFPTYRDPNQPWILMTYESANSIRQRAYYKVSGNKNCCSLFWMYCTYLSHIHRANIQDLLEDDLEGSSTELWLWEKIRTLLPDMDLWRKERLQWHPQRWKRFTVRFLTNPHPFTFLNIIKISDIDQLLLYGLFLIAMILMAGINWIIMVIKFHFLGAFTTIFQIQIC